ncbi:MAG: DNA-3-methyladenine glycosylase, partial [Chloroflexota bacterium]|nr:DNA-3-methyladenine glycosylase [Chloroflexota bacterium]
RLDRAFYAQPTVNVARALLGCVLVTNKGGGETRGRIVETEAYLGPDDPASHAATRRTGGARAMWDSPGIAYVYRSYGIHAMFNVVCEQEGVPGAVLIRAVEPTKGLDLMRERRGQVPDRLLCAGPGRLCTAMGITLEDHGQDLTASTSMWIEQGVQVAGVVASGRIGISRGTEAPWRFFEGGSRYVSAHRRGAPVE